MIRVLHMIASLGIGGTQAMIMNLYRTIDRSKVQFDFIIDHSDSPRHTYFADEIKQLGGNIYIMPTFKGSNILEIVKAWDCFFKEHREYGILHNHARSYACIYLPIAKKYGVKTIAHSHSTSNGKGISALIKKILQYPLRYQADYFFGCSMSAGEWLFGRKIANSSNYYLIRNAVDLDNYRFNSDIRKEYRKWIGAKENIVVYVHVGRLHESKNHSFLLNVFAEIQKEKENSLLVLVGEGELREKIEKQAKALLIDDRVVMLGIRSDVHYIFQASDYFLFPSLWEGLPVTVIEAQAAGVPCFISDKVTSEVNISELVTSLPIDKGVKPWVDAIMQTSIKRKDVSSEIINAGFDIQRSAQWIMKFYDTIGNEGHCKS